jgi:crotonobetainyl-CoA:carnitine CoA-transferase CaiB-like acyl-CoA transferase
MERVDSPTALGRVLVVDFSRVLAGPLATMLLGDLGADVIKVERPGSGDDTRAWGPPYVDGESAYFLAVNRNKRSIAIDPSAPEGKAVARRLAGKADVVVENFKSGTMRRLGLSYDEVAAINPGVVYCTISGFGTKGQGASLLGYDFIVQAVGGLMHITGAEAGEPTKVGVAVADVLTGLFAANAILAALLARSRLGKGQQVEVDLMSCLLAGLVNQASTFVTTGEIPRALGNRHPSISPYEMFTAKDRPLVIAVGNDGQFACLADGSAWRGWSQTIDSLPTRPVSRTVRRSRS